jgi:hypothetical protein
VIASIAMRGCALALLGVMAGCVTHRGEAWQRMDADPPAEPGVTLVLLGDAGAPGRTSKKVARRLAATLRGESARGRDPVVLWLGNNMLPTRGRKRCADPSTAWSREGVADLAAAVKGHASYAIPGEAEWRCGIVDAKGPWVRPAPHYVVRLGREGAHAVVLACTEKGCKASAGPEDAIVELVFVDIVPWMRTTASRKQVPELAALDRIIDAIEQPSSVPRILVSHYPVEAAGFHGQGGGDPDSTIHSWPPRLRDAIGAGAFVGVVAAHDRSTYLTEDLADATMRSDRVFLARPMFEIVSGTASRPDARPATAYRRLRYATSIALLPSVYTPRAGFALVRLGATEAEAELHAGRGRSWETARVQLALQPKRSSVVAETPSMAPCLRCVNPPPSERP